MIRLMIVDDEYSIRKGIRHYIDWSTWGIQVSETGIYGDPTCASAEEGRLIFEEATAALVDFCREFHSTPPANWGW